MTSERAEFIREYCEQNGVMTPSREAAVAIQQAEEAEARFAYSIALDQTAIETVYTAYALTARCQEEIECYGTAQEAVQDMLELWPEDEEGDVAIEDNDGRLVVLMVRDAGDPAIAHVYFLADGASLDHVESYHCHYEPAQGGSVRTIIKRLG